MKKALVTILAILYLSLNVGAAVRVHYCMGEFVNFSLLGSKNSVCSKCGMQNHNNDNDCCKDLKVIKKAIDTHQTIHADHLLTTVSKAVSPQNYWCREELITVSTASFTLSQEHSPPDTISNLLYIKYRNFRI